MSAQVLHPYPRREEMAHAVTHGVGALLSVVGLVALLLRTDGHDNWNVVASTVYGTSLILLFTASTLYHAVSGARAKRILQQCDHAAIYLLIAGTYTPFALISLRGAWGWSIFGVVWGLAVAGIVFELLNRHRASRRWSLVFYIGLGWVAVVAIRPLLAAVPVPGLVLLLAGGVCYTGGAVFYVMRRLSWHHAIWHVFVLGGSLAHFICVYRFVLA